MMGKYFFLICFSFLYLSLTREDCAAQKNSDDIYEDGVILHVINADMGGESWTLPPDQPDQNSFPLSMTIWISLVLGIFILMAVAVCCALFCKYSGRLSSSRDRELRSPIPIIITPPSRTSTVTSFQNGSDLGYSNHGYNGGTQMADKDVPPRYMDVTTAGRANASSSRVAAAGGKMETPPPMYMTVAPFK